MTRVFLDPTRRNLAEFSPEAAIYFELIAVR